MLDDGVMLTLSVTAVCANPALEERASVEEGAVCAAEEPCDESVPFVVLAEGADASRLFKFTGACDCAFESPVKSIFLMESAEEAAFTPYKSALEA